VKTTGNPKIMMKFLKTVELRGTSETRKTSKVRPYAITTVYNNIVSDKLYYCLIFGTTFDCFNIVQG